jgi:type I restriction enzyme S subunit
MSEWKEINFYEVLEDESISYGIVQPGSHIEENSVPIIRVQNIKNGNIDITDIKKVGKSIEEKYKRTRLVGGELLITVVGSVGECAIVPKKLAGWNVARAVSVARIKDDYDINFIRYLFSTEDLKFQMYGNTNDTVQPTLNLKELKTLKLLSPPLPEQKAIAEVLSSLDDKIDLLHRQNKTLEQMAETLFRQWFVEEAKEDWEERPLSSIATFLNGLACQKYPPKNDIEKLPVLKIKQLRNGFSEDCDWCKTDVKPEYLIKNGDVIFSWSASLMVKIWDGDNCILNQHLFKVTSDEFPKWYYYLWSKHHLEEFISISASHATTMGHIKRGDLDNAIVLVPTYDEITEFSEIQTPIIDKIIANSKQLKKLVSMRDTLLPKLMNGEVRVKMQG